MLSDFSDVRGNIKHEDEDGSYLWELQPHFLVQKTHLDHWGVGVWVIILLVADEAVDCFPQVKGAGVQVLFFTVVCAPIDAPLVDNVVFWVQPEVDDVFDVGERDLGIFAGGW